MSMDCDVKAGDWNQRRWTELARLPYREYGRGCQLSLADGGCWWLTAEPDASSWFQKLAAIMELEECELNGAPKLIFSKMEHISDERDAGSNTNLTKEAVLYRPHPNLPPSKGKELRVITINPSKQHNIAPPMMIPDALALRWVCYDYETTRIWVHDGIPDAVCEVALNEGRGGEYVNMRSSLQPIYQRSISLGGMPFHAALAEIEGRGVLLAGWSGTGKSTCSRRLPPYWKPLCDDETLVVLDEQKQYRAHPFPTWGDYICEREEKTWNVQYSVPLCGVFFLEYGERDEVTPVGEGQAAVSMNESAAQVCRRFWMKVDGQLQRRFRKELFHNACEMAKRIPAFRLRVSLHGRFWQEIEEVIYH